MAVAGLVTFLEAQTYSSDYFLSQKYYKAMTDSLGSRPEFSVVCFMYQFVDARDFHSTFYVPVFNQRLYTMMKLHMRIS